MKLLLLHQNFPGQFRQLTPYLIKRGHQLVAICSHQRPLPEVEGLRVLRYDEPLQLSGENPYGSQLWHEALQRAEAVGVFSNSWSLRVGGPIVFWLTVAGVNPCL